MNEFGITLVVQNPTDFTGPMIGIAGVVLGGILGFIGIRWQQRANVLHQVRQKAGELLVSGRDIRQAYDVLANPDRAADANPVDSVSIETTTELAREMEVILAYLFFVADNDVFNVCSAFVEHSSSMQRMAARLHEDPDAKIGPSWNVMTIDWCKAENALRSKLRASRAARIRPRWTQWQSRRLARKYDRANA